MRILAELCNQKNVNPSKGNYAGFIQKMAITHLQVSISSVKELTTSLTIAYRTDKWQSLLGINEAQTQGYNSDITKKEVNYIQHQPSIQSELQRLAQTTQPTPLKTMPTKPAYQPDHLTQQQIAKILYGTATKDTFDGIGRLILSEARQITENKTMQIEELAQFWQQHYPLIDAEIRGNVLLIFWDGKEDVRSIRDLNKLVQPKDPSFYAKNNPEGDISEDDCGVLPEQTLSQGEG